MPHRSYDLRQALSDLISSCNNSRKGLGKAAEGAHQDNLRRWLEEVTAERAEFGRVLGEELKKLGGTPPKIGPGSGTSDSGWVDLEQRIQGKDDVTLRRESADGEESTIHHYERALTLSMPGELRNLIEGQLNAIRATVDQLRFQHLKARASRR